MRYLPWLDVQKCPAAPDYGPASAAGGNSPAATSFTPAAAGRLRSISAGKPRVLRELFDAFLAILRASGPVRLHPTKTRIGFIARMTFANMTVMSRKLRVGLILSRRARSRRWVKVEQYGPRCFGH